MGMIFIALLILGWYYPILGYFIPLCMLLGLGIGLFRGRKWCDWYCPRGSFYDVLVGAVSPKKEIPGFLKHMYFRVATITFLMSVMTFNIIRRWPDINRIGMFFMVLITITTILGIILALIFHPRTWCSFCPIGTMVNLVGRNKYPLKINSALCVECRLCYKNCPIQIKPYIFKGKGTQVVRDGDCLKCNLCVMICPKKALRRG